MVKLPKASGGRFGIAGADQQAFAAFAQRHEGPYGAFVHQHAPGNLPSLDRDLKREMKILFKWSRQMEPWRARVL